MVLIDGHSVGRQAFLEVVVLFVLIVLLGFVVRLGGVDRLQQFIFCSCFIFYGLMLVVVLAM